MICPTCHGIGLVLARAAAFPPGFLGFAGASLRRHGGTNGPVLEVTCPECQGSCFAYCCTGSDRDAAQPANGS
jgi:hypothetical protein